ncbi:Sec14 cytosolic factor [Diplonema papillatum]|nr:Sec14 cytosolic factor [Diplonema papillatum]
MNDSLAAMTVVLLIFLLIAGGALFLMKERLSVIVAVWSFAWMVATSLVVAHSDEWALVTAAPGCCFLTSILVLSKVVGSQVGHLLKEEDTPEVSESEVKVLLKAIHDFAAPPDLLKITSPLAPPGSPERSRSCEQPCTPTVPGGQKGSTFEFNGNGDPFADVNGGIRLVSAPVHNGSAAASQAGSARGPRKPAAPRQKTCGQHVLTEDHHRAKAELERRIRDLLPLPDVNKLNDDDAMYRFIIARDCSVTQAERMLRHAVKWRLSENINEINSFCVGKFKKDLQAYVRCAYYGVDREGYPVIWQTPNPLRIKTLFDDHGPDGATLLNLYLAERCREVAKAAGAERFTFVINLKDTGSSVFYGQIGEVLRAQMKATQLVYPECMRRCVICNPPWVFERLFALVKGLLDPKVQQKIMVGNAALHEVVASENTPAEFGGTATIPWDEIAIPMSGKPLPPLKKAKATPARAQRR